MKTNLASAVGVDLGELKLSKEFVFVRDSDPPPPPGDIKLILSLSGFFGMMGRCERSARG